MMRESELVFAVGDFMESMMIMVSSKLLGSDDTGKNEISSINVSALGAPHCDRIYVKHPVYDLICTNPRVILNDSINDPMRYDGAQYSQDPANVGGALTTTGATYMDMDTDLVNADLLSRFKLNDHNFTQEGLHMMLDLIVEERGARMYIGPKNSETVLQFDRNRNSSNIMEVS
ncbi:MAG: hypothetical protein U9Q68_05655 [Euryarchaeota archaeon]|nr:hypothetical protein [Euryarchaeota archaeon]